MWLSISTYLVWLGNINGCFVQSGESMHTPGLHPYIISFSLLISNILLLYWTQYVTIRLYWSSVPSQRMKKFQRWPIGSTTNPPHFLLGPSFCFTDLNFHFQESVVNWSSTENRHRPGTKAKMLAQWPCMQWAIQLFKCKHMGCGIDLG